MYKEALRPAWVEIDLKKLDRNIKNIKAKANGREVIGVIKADAYGHGAVKCAEVLRKNGIKTFAIATLHEAIELREAGATEEIIMLGLTPSMYADTLVKYHITPVVCDSETIWKGRLLTSRKSQPFPTLRLKGCFHIWPLQTPLINHFQGNKKTNITNFLRLS